MKALVISTGDAGFPRTVRLLDETSYRRVFRRGDRFSDPWFTVLWRENALGFPRLGLVVSRKSLSRAVDRNFVKRAARESFRQRLRSLQAMDIVVVSRRGLPGVRRREVRESLRRHWSRLEQVDLGRR